MAENLTDPQLANKDKENKNKQDSIKNMNTLNKKQDLIKNAHTTTNNKDDYYNKENQIYEWRRSFEQQQQQQQQRHQHSFTWQ